MKTIRKKIRKLMFLLLIATLVTYTRSSNSHNFSSTTMPLSEPSIFGTIEFN